MRRSKTVLGHRLKQSAMFWTVIGSNTILALRCSHLNGAFEDYWHGPAGGLISTAMSRTPLHIVALRSCNSVVEVCMRNSIFAFALTVSATWAQPTNTFDVVDLSFLIPPGENAIRIADSTKGHPILSDAFFNQFGDFITRGHPGVERPWEKLIVTGFRFDPCGPVYPVDWDIAKCVLPNLRIIAQVYDKGQTSTAALHMVFTLGVKVDQDRASIQSGSGFDRTVREGVIQEIRQMKARNAAAGIVTNGVPVGVHPAFSPGNRASQRTQAFLAEFEQLIRHVALESNYFTTAVMFTDNRAGNQLAGKERWVWQKGNVQRVASPPGIRIVPGGIPCFDPGTKEQSLTANLDSRSGVEIVPKSTIENGGVPNALIDSIMKGSSEFDWTQFQRAIDIADTMDNPDRVMVQTDDCVSCHAATTARVYTLTDGRLGWVKRGNAFRFDARAASLAGSLSREDTEWQGSPGYRVMSLAFFKGKASVSQRTVNETGAALLDSFNSLRMAMASRVRKPPTTRLSC